jgi:hypothetical protein
MSGSRIAVLAHRREITAGRIDPTSTRVEQAADGLHSDGDEVRLDLTGARGPGCTYAIEQVIAQLHARRCGLLRVRELDLCQGVP